MRGCELCGKKGYLVFAAIEGVEMQVCNGCSPHGKAIPRPVPPKKTASSKKQKKYRPVEEENLEMIRHDFSEVLRGERRRRNMTQSEFAQLCNEKESMLTHYEKGSHKPSIVAGRRLEKTLGIKLIEISNTTSPLEIHKKSTGTLTIGDMINVKK